MRLQHGTLRLLYCSLETVPFNTVEDIALLYQVALLEQDALQEACHPGADFHSFDGFHPTDKFARLGDRPQFGCHGADRNGSGLLRRDLRRCGEKAKQGDGLDMKAHRFPPVAIAAALVGRL